MASIERTSVTPGEGRDDLRKARPHELLDELVERHAREIQLFLARLCGNHHDAEELTQDAFVKAYRNLHELREPAAARRWLYAIALNGFHDWVKPRKRAFLRSLATFEEAAARPSDAAPPEHEVMARELGSALIKSALELPRRQRDVVLMFAAKGFGYADIGEALGITPEAAKMSLFYAREKLRRKTERWLS